MSLADFCSISVDEWDAIYEKYMDTQKAEWERMRIHLAMSMQPFVGKKKVIRPRDLVPLPWDNRMESQKVVSREEGEARFRSIMERINHGNDKD